MSWTWMFRYPTRPGQVLAPGALDGALGKQARVGPAEGTVVAVHVAADGLSAAVTLDFADGESAQLASLPDQDFHLEMP